MKLRTTAVLTVALMLLACLSPGLRAQTRDDARAAVDRLADVTEAKIAELSAAVVRADALAAEVYRRTEEVRLLQGMTASMRLQIADLEAQLGTLRSPPWPARICMNADYRVMRAPTLYGPDTWIAPRVRYGPGVDHAAALRYYDQMITMLTARGAVLGRELSATTIAAAADFNGHPSECIDSGRFGPPAVTRGTWPGEPWRSFVDLSHTPTREQQAAFLIEAVTATGAKYAFLDNGPALLNGQADAAIEFVRDVSQRASAAGVRLIWNFALVPGSFGGAGYLPLADWQRLLAALRGHAILFEQPWPATVKTRPDLTAKSAEQYRMIGDAGVVAVLLETVEPLPELAAWVKTWRRPGVDRVYLTTLFSEPEPTWAAL